MEDELLYSTVVFSNPGPVVSEDAKIDNVVYSEITKTKEEASANSCVTAGQISTVGDDAISPRHTSYRLATAALGLLCVLLLAGLTTMCVLNIEHVSKYTSISTLYHNESTAHRMLLVDTAALETEKEELTAQRDQLKNTLQLITRFKQFPVSSYCTLTNEEVHCKCCMTGWIQNGSSCYFWTEKPLLDWEDSQTYCAEREGHLVVIDTAEEQEFIRQNIRFYFDKYHGYWMGLAKQKGVWVWTNGAELQDSRFWNTPSDGSQGSCAISNPFGAALNNWQPKSCSMYNRFICEMKVMEWPSQM